MYVLVIWSLPPFFSTFLLLNNFFSNCDHFSMVASFTITPTLNTQYLYISNMFILFYKPILWPIGWGEDVGVKVISNILIHS